MSMRLSDWRSPEFAIGAVGDAVLKHKSGSVADLTEFRGLLDMTDVIDILAAYAAHGLLQLTGEDSLFFFALPTDPDAAKKLEIETQKLMTIGSAEVVLSWLHQDTAKKAKEAGCKT